MTSLQHSPGSRTMEKTDDVGGGAAPSTPASHGLLVLIRAAAFPRSPSRGSGFWVYAYPAFLRYAAHSEGGYWARILPRASEIASQLCAPTFRRRVLNLAKTCSIGLRSREYFGRNTRRAGSDIPDRFAHRQVATTTAYPDPLFPLALIDAESVPTRGAQHLSFTA